MCHAKSDGEVLLVDSRISIDLFPLHFLTFSFLQTLQSLFYIHKLEASEFTVLHSLSCFCNRLSLNLSSSLHSLYYGTISSYRSLAIQYLSAFANESRPLRISRKLHQKSWLPRWYACCWVPLQRIESDISSVNRSLQPLCSPL